MAKEPGSRKNSAFWKFDRFIMRFVGPANRRSINLRGNDQMSEETKNWYAGLQDEYEMVKDANGNSYLRRKDS